MNTHMYIYIYMCVCVCIYIYKEKSMTMIYDQQCPLRSLQHVATAPPKYMMS